MAIRAKSEKSREPTFLTHTPLQQMTTDHIRFSVLAAKGERRRWFDGYAFSLGGLTSIHVASGVEVMRADCLSECKSLASVFSLSGLTSIHVPSSVEVVSEYCFSQCESLASATPNPGRNCARPYQVC
jgi:hypothetical protein